MRVDLFDFDLPDENIALRPASPRDSARLLVIDPNANSMTDHQVCDLPSFLKPGDALVFNDTRVIPAQLEGVRLREGAPETAVSATLHMRADASRWKAFARPGKRIKQGDRIRFGYESDNACGAAFLEATVEEKGEEGEITLLFDVSGPVLDEAIASVGHIPLPPYIAAKRPEDAQDQIDYQTIYAREKGAVAAPTAGLHFTPALFEALDKAGVERHFVTLHVGAGTFLPVKADDTEEHKMHLEIGYVSEETSAKLNAVKARGGRIVCVGTTSLRLIESAAGDDGQIKPWSGPTGIFITPGYRFKAVDILMTNFHLPKSTLFMLVSAFCGLETMREAYARAIDAGYRFYSYGDSSLLFRKN
ncbi:tRNA preQ1(34) S-adenosylmethionine ribosyltransferase-isomerase QueA [Agrobacterium sp. rho-13.3]|uniref:tRNA preQ1(34) S-adenosylmethionine ribosyltransferase-isomerase QueA n=1 Tax=Agrobacterium sp. rho-13.3 TaxID=3072980 RepID=UPI002A171AFD|nr:tRNA preQ1(34) S-adenosylmethionine ribosyltransferase-isomerase QueA [Agrobacterium sp. rho-13.3]MDX8311155.1 tRNA preQ1(34) S-adenosylmethionine ribosyltransferase-isomerase QueA [Agrobacterium sp. rho-13.3]